MIINILNLLYNEGVQSVIIEGGSVTIQSFIDLQEWDEARIFVTKKLLKEGKRAPNINKNPIKEKQIETDILKIIYND